MFFTKIGPCQECPQPRASGVVLRTKEALAVHAPNRRPNDASNHNPEAKTFLVGCVKCHRHTQLDWALFVFNYSKYVLSYTTYAL